MEQQQQNHTLESLRSLGVKVAETMTTPSRPGKKPRPVWVVSGNIFGLVDFFYEIGGKKYRGAWSFFRDPSADILGELNSNGRKGFAEQMQGLIDRKMARADKFEGYSESAAVRSESAFNKVQSISSMIPPGQPILVGHHSERRHRRDLDRMDSGMRKGVEESKKSEYYADRARSIGYQVDKMTNSRRYINNRLKEARRELASLKRWTEESLGKANQEDLHRKIAQAQEKIDFWQSRLSEIEAKREVEGQQIAPSETIKVGDLVYYIGSWMPVIRVNKKSVTVSHWMGIPHFKYIIEYARIEKFRSPEKKV